MKARDVIAYLQTLDPDTEIEATDCAYCQGEESGNLEFQDYGNAIHITGRGVSA